MEFKTLRILFKHAFNLFILSTMSFAVFAEVELLQGHVKAMPASVPNTAAYLTLKNTGSVTKKLVAVTTDIAREAQLHTMLMEDGMMKMRQVEAFYIPVGGQLTLTQGGDHIMILGLEQPLVVDQKVSLLLIFADGDQLSLTVPVKQPQTGMSGHHHHH